MKIGLAAANNSLAKLVKLAEAGEVVTITRNGRPVAELRRIWPRPRRRGEDPVRDMLADIEMNFQPEE